MYRGSGTGSNPVSIYLSPYKSALRSESNPPVGISRVLVCFYMGRLGMQSGSIPVRGGPDDGHGRFDSFTLHHNGDVA